MSNKLIISLSGQVTRSNFSEWKDNLLDQLSLTNVELSTDNDFSEAKLTVKSFKGAEKSLKQAKINAINQISDIQELFDAIDEVVERTRQTRLTLERQIKTRTIEIKEQIVQSGVDEIVNYIKDQESLVQAVDLRKYTDKSIFQSAIKGKLGSKGAKLAIYNVCEKIKLEISNKVLQIRINGTILDTIPLEHKAMFQDQSYLLSLSEENLNSAIDSRINAYNQNKIINKTIIPSVKEKGEDTDGQSLYSHEDLEEIKFVLRALLDGCSPVTGELIDGPDQLKDPVIKKALENCLKILDKNL
jgi:hypothetical protein